MIDTHCHLTFPQLIDRADEVIRDARAAGVERMITIGLNAEDARRALAIAERHEGVYVTAGLHPHEATAGGVEVAALRDLLGHPRVVAVGEMGLDRHYPDPPIVWQRQAFEQQLALMRDLPQPTAGVIHNREATDETLAVLRDSGIPASRFVFHCFTGDERELDAILDAGAMVSYTGVVTFRNGRALAEASDRVPLDRLMVETDAPYLTPEPHRKVKVNEPKYVVHVAAFLAARRGMSVEDFTAAADANAERFFGLPTAQPI